MTLRANRWAALAAVLLTTTGGCAPSVDDHDRPCATKVLHEDIELGSASTPGQLAVLEGVTEVVGDVVVDGYEGSLEPMSCLREVKGLLLISGDAVDSLEGLSQLREAGGVVISNAPNLESLDGLERLENPGGLTLSYLPALHSTSALENLESIGGELWLERLPEVDDWSGLAGVGGITERLHILEVSDAAPLEISLGDRFAGDIFIDIRSPDLRSATSSLTRLDGRLVAGVGTSTQLDLSQLEEVDGGLHLSSDEPVPLPDLSALRSVAESLQFHRMEMTDLSTLSQLEAVGSLDISDCAKLQSLTGLESLTTVAFRPGEPGADGVTSTISLSDNEVLTDISALGSVTNFGRGGFPFAWIRRNPALSDLTGLATIAGQAIGVELEDLPALTDLTGLSGLYGLADLTIRNTGVRSLDGFSLNPDAELGDALRLAITQNAALEDIAALFPIFDRPVPTAGWMLFDDQPMLGRCQATALVDAAQQSGFAGESSSTGLRDDGPC